MDDDTREMANPEPGLRSAVSAYLGFIAALFLTVIIASGSVARSGFIVGLLAVSLPALGAWLYIESSGWMGPEPMCKIVRAVVITVALACSLYGVFLTVWSFTGLGAFLVVVQVPLWYLAISGVAYFRDDAGR